MRVLHGNPRTVLRDEDKISNIWCFLRLTNQKVYISHIPLCKISLGPLGTCPIMFQDLRGTLESPSNVSAPATIVSMDGTKTLRV